MKNPPESGGHAKKISKNLSFQYGPNFGEGTSAPRFAVACGLEEYPNIITARRQGFGCVFGQHELA